MARSGGLWHLCNADDVTDAHFPRQEKVQDSQPCAVRESAEHQIDSLFAHELYSLRRI
jgi:hypothetical protein